MGREGIEPSTLGLRVALLVWPRNDLPLESAREIGEATIADPAVVGFTRMAFRGRQALAEDASVRGHEGAILW